MKALVFAAILALTACTGTPDAQPTLDKPAFGEGVVWPETDGICGVGCKSYHPPRFDTGSRALDRELERLSVERQQEAELLGLRHRELIEATEGDMTGGLY